MKDWYSITTREFLEIAALNDNDFDYELDKAVAILNIIGDKKNYNFVPVKDLMKDMEGLKFLNEEKPKCKLPSSVMINGTEYKINADIQKVQTSQLFDYLNLNNADMDKNEKYIRMLAVFMIPVGYDNYGEGYDFEKAVNDAGDMRFIEANEIAFFLHRQYKKLQKTTLLYLTTEIMTMKGKSWKEKKQLVKDLYHLNNMGFFHI